MDAKANLALYAALSRAMGGGLVAACHDCSDGGLGAALAEMALAGELGVSVDLSKIPADDGLRAQKRSDKVLFSESNGRFIVEVAPKFRKKFESTLRGLPFGLIGQVKPGSTLQVKGLRGKKVSWSVEEITKAWTGGVKP